MDSKTKLMKFLDEFFKKLEGFPPAPGVVTYDRIILQFHHPAEQLRLDGAIALAKARPNGRLGLRLVFELEGENPAQRPVQVEVKGESGGPLELAATRDHFKEFAANLLAGFSAGLATTA